MGVVVTLILIVGTGISTIPFNSVYAQNKTTLGEPFFVEKGKVYSASLRVKETLRAEIL
jgi:hypothetical protein